MSSSASICGPADRGSMAIENCLCCLRLGAQHGPFRNAAVPFDQRRDGSAPRDHALEKVPDRVGHLPIVAVDQEQIAFVVGLLGMPGEMDFPDMAQREVSEIACSGIAVIRRGYEGIVYIEQQAAS